MEKDTERQALADRISEVMAETGLNQKELAQKLDVSTGFISRIRKSQDRGISRALANVAEIRLGYRAEWLMTGEPPKYASHSSVPGLSDTHRRVLAVVEKLPEQHLLAVQVFLDSLERVARIYKGEAEQD